MARFSLTGATGAKALGKWSPGASVWVFQADTTPVAIPALASVWSASSGGTVLGQPLSVGGDQLTVGWLEAASSYLIRVKDDRHYDYLTGANYAALMPVEYGSVVGAYPAAAVTSNPVDSAGTANTTATMMGLAGSITPLTTGRVTISITGSISQATSGKVTQAKIRTGTGTAPANGDAATGTARGNFATLTAAAAAQKVPFTCQTLATGLVLGTAVWIDLSVLVNSGASTGAVVDVNINAIEL